MKRIIVFGDIHGCYDEWQALMEKLSVTSDDQLVSVGDMICRGPASVKCLDWAMSHPRFSWVLGNHELRFLKAWKEGEKPGAKSYDLDVVKDMGDRFGAYMQFLAQTPFYLDGSEFLVLHAGLRPGIALKHQTAEDLTEIREFQNRPWYEFYKGRKPVVFGHWVRREPLLREHVIGLDTGCVYGGKLSAYVYPDHRVTSVPARKVYYVRTKSWA